MEKLIWKVKHNTKFTEEEDFLGTILTELGVEDIPAFLNVNESNTFDPFLFKNMEQGIDLLHKVLQKEHPIIALLQDSDVDGLTSSSFTENCIYEVYQEHHEEAETLYVEGYRNPEAVKNITFLVLHQFKKEHGLTYKNLVNTAKQEDIGIEDIDLIICPDSTSGDDSIEECKKIKEEFNIPILVLDHHEIDDRIYDYTVNINSTDGQYPNPTLSGVGVVYKFFRAYCHKYQLDRRIPDYYLDLVALGMVADTVDLRNLESRYLVLEGLKEENHHNTLIKAFEERFEEEMKDGHTIRNLGWVIAPKMNATIRVGKKEEQINLYRAICNVKEDVEYQPRRKHKDDPKPPVEIHSLQKTMARVCSNVKQRQDNSKRKIMETLENKIQEEGLDKNSVIIVDGTEALAKENISGLVANILAEKYKRPTLVLRKNIKESDEENGKIVFGGSARSYERGNVEYFKALSTFLTGTGLIQTMGHENACGINLHSENISKLIEKCNELIDINDITTVYEVDYEIKGDDLTPEAVLEVANFRDMWGNKVDEPKFGITNIFVQSSDVQAFGDNKNFVKLRYNGVDYVRKYCNSGFYDTVIHRDRNTFGAGNKLLKVTIIGSFCLNEFEGKTYPQVKIEQIYTEEIKKLPEGVELKEADKPKKKDTPKAKPVEDDDFWDDLDEIDNRTVKTPIRPTVVPTPQAKKPVVEDDDFDF